MNLRGNISWGELRIRLTRVSIHDTFVCVIKSFQHKGLEKFFRTGSKSGIQPQHAKRLREQLTVLNVARMPEDVNRHGWGFHPLSQELEGHWAIRVDRMWRLTFMFEGEDVILLDYQDYHKN